MLLHCTLRFFVFVEDFGCDSRNVGKMKTLGVAGD
jgi:hypothetical protein